MNKIKWVALVCFLGSSVLLFLHFFCTSTSNHQTDFAVKANLAIRQAVHNLHKIVQDSTSKIAAVKHTTAHTYQVKIEKQINYEKLPLILDTALQDFSIEEKYTVAIKDCNNEEILLGYNWLALKNDNVACQNRTRENDCEILEVTFDVPQVAKTPYLLLSFLSGVIGILSLFIAAHSPKTPEIKTQESALETRTIQIGNSLFKPQDLSIQIGKKSKNLTFRESKLLEYLALRPNQVLQREAIQDAVWSEEGVIVGRSLDVFISRLRKILQEDPMLQIKNIHGVGYRLEVGGV